MDTALMLRIKLEKGIFDSEKDSSLLSQSKLIEKLTNDFQEHPLFACFRIMGLCEIPCSQKLEYTQHLISFINDTVATDKGFSCLGGVSEIVPCYNAMLLEAYCRLGLAKSRQAQAALEWIMLYQLFERNQTTTWSYSGICKHGGCLGRTPCYIGIGKTVRALITYTNSIEKKDESIENMIDKGVTYMLQHKMYQKLSNGAPICQHITDIMMPQNYALSLTDLVYIVGKRNLQNNKNTKPMLDLLKEKQTAENKWKIDYLYSYKGYVGFETRRKPSEWISNLFPLWLKDTKPL